jgi:hypothetical protein
MNLCVTRALLSAYFTQAGRLFHIKPVGYFR